MPGKEWWTPERREAQRQRMKKAHAVMAANEAKEEAQDGRQDDPHPNEGRSERGSVREPGLEGDLREPGASVEGDEARSEDRDAGRSEGGSPRETGLEPGERESLAAGERDGHQ